MLQSNINVNSKGHLTFGNVDAVEMADKYGTPLYLMDEDRIRNNCRVYTEAVKKYFKGNAIIYYASKALCTKDVLRIVSEEGLCIDVVSQGEIYTALKAGISPEKLNFHGNNKTDEEINYALDNGVGCFVVDNIDELDYLNECAANKNIVQNIVLRLTPGIDPHTFEAVATGKVDSKFGVAITTGQAFSMLKHAMSLKNICVKGFHCHIGSQCFDSQVFFDAADVMIKFVYEAFIKLDYKAEILNLGGGYGVRYTDKDPYIDIDANIAQVAKHINATCHSYYIDAPTIAFEPGRSIVADAGITLYTVGSVKTITGYKNYASIDGGMTDNPRYALYKSNYTVINASHADGTPDMTATVAGRCCESGCMIKEDAELKTPVRGDKLAVFVTGAYNYSMSSNYNRVPRPPIVMLHNGEDRLSLKRETLEDIIQNDI